MVISKYIYRVLPYSLSIYQPKVSQFFFKKKYYRYYY